MRCFLVFDNFVMIKFVMSPHLQYIYIYIYIYITINTKNITRIRRFCKEPFVIHSYFFLLPSYWRGHKPVVTGLIENRKHEKISIKITFLG